MKNYFLGGMLALVSCCSIAADQDTAYFTIDKLRNSSNTGYLYVFPNGEVEVKNETCAVQNRYAIHKDDQLFSEIYSLALSAAMAGKSVKAWLSTDANNCLGGYQRITLLEVDF